MLAFAVPPLLEAYQVAEPAARSGPALAFTVVTDVAYKGIWQTLDPILIGTWALGTGLALRNLRSSLGAAGIALGVISLIASAMRMSGVDLDTTLLLVSAAIWAAAFWLYVGWFAMHLARGSLPSSSD